MIPYGAVPYQCHSLEKHCLWSAHEGAGPGCIAFHSNRFYSIPSHPRGSVHERRGRRGAPIKQREPRPRRSRTFVRRGSVALFFVIGDNTATHSHSPHVLTDKIDDGRASGARGRRIMDPARTRTRTRCASSRRRGGARRGESQSINESINQGIQ